MFRRIDHLALHVSDVTAAVNFYVDVLGFARVPEWSNTSSQARYVRLDDFMIELTGRPDGEPMSGFHFCLEVSDFAKAYSTLLDRGLTLLKEPRPSTPRAPHQVNWNRAVFCGPNGEMIEIKGG